MNPTMKKFGYPDTLVTEYKHWVVLLKPKQTTVSTLVLVAKSGATQLGQLTADEWAEFALVCNETEAKLSTTFRPDKFNYLALMMKDPNVHFHLVPRYSQPVNINGNSYSDTDWPLATKMGELEISTGDMKAIKRKLLNET